MASLLNPYISFKDTAREAMEFYKSVFGGELTFHTFGEMAHDSSEKDKIMHALLKTAGGFTVMGSDTPAGMEHRPGTDMSISISGDNEAEMRGYWSQLSAGAHVIMPLEKAPWGDIFGMLADKFGTKWMVNIGAVPV